MLVTRAAFLFLGLSTVGCAGGQTGQDEQGPYCEHAEVHAVTLEEQTKLGFSAADALSRVGVESGALRRAEAGDGAEVTFQVLHLGEARFAEAEEGWWNCAGEAVEVEAEVEITVQRGSETFQARFETRLRSVNSGVLRFTAELPPEAVTGTIPPLPAGKAVLEYVASVTLTSDGWAGSLTRSFVDEAYFEPSPGRDRFFVATTERLAVWPAETVCSTEVAEPTLPVPLASSFGGIDLQEALGSTRFAATLQWDGSAATDLSIEMNARSETACFATGACVECDFRHVLPSAGSIERVGAPVTLAAAASDGSWTGSYDTFLWAGVSSNGLAGRLVRLTRTFDNAEALARGTGVAVDYTGPAKLDLIVELDWVAGEAPRGTVRVWTNAFTSACIEEPTACPLGWVAKGEITGR